jgi:hypothetical protein
VVDRVDDRGVGADVAELAEPFDAELVHLPVFLGKHDDLDVVDVGVDGDQVLREIGVVVARGAAIDLGRLVERRRHASDQAAHQSAFRGERVDDLAGGKRSKTRGQRISRVRSCTRTSTNSAPIGPTIWSRTCPEFQNSWNGRRFRVAARST